MTPREWTDRLCQILDDRSCPLDDEDREAIQEVIEAAVKEEREECEKLARSAYERWEDRVNGAPKNPSYWSGKALGAWGVMDDIQARGRKVSK